MSANQKSYARAFAGWLSRSPFLSSGRKLYKRNRSDWHLRLSKLEKVQCGLFMILRDYGEGLFPPTFADQAKAYEGEINYNENLPGVPPDEVEWHHMRKPFGTAQSFEHYSRQHSLLLKVFGRVGLKPGDRILELGCGSGWMAEFLALGGYSVLGTTISPSDVKMAEKRIQALKIKGTFGDLAFLACPMETIAESAQAEPQFDAVIVFEALHHAYDWRAALRSAYSVLKPGGWMIVANEPNILHTFISYRIACLSNTHEIGMSRRKIFAELKAVGYENITAVRPRLNDFVSAHWIVAQR